MRAIMNFKSIYSVFVMMTLIRKFVDRYFLIVLVVPDSNGGNTKEKNARKFEIIDEFKCSRSSSEIQWHPQILADQLTIS